MTAGANEGESTPVQLLYHWSFTRKTAKVGNRISEESLMKRFLLVLFTCVLAGALAWATPQPPSLTPVKARAQRHHAHKAGKHRHPKRHHRSV
jgi:hypothetical protein